MTVRGFLLATAVLAASPVESAALCHRYSIWKYPWRQACHGGRPIGREMAHWPSGAKSASGANNPDSRRAGSSATILLPAAPTSDIPIPFLGVADFGGGEPDDVTRARLQLMGYAYAH